MSTLSTTSEMHEAANRANASFWDELCGTQLARSLGINDSSPESLKRFDDWYFAFYPYLPRHIPFHEMRGMSVLEVGLGYGTVAQRLAESCATYQGLDVAAGPVQMVNHRLGTNGLSGNASQGSVLAAPFGDETFDYVVAIGCFHHTGDVQRAVDESWRMLKAGGQLIFMVYYSYSYRRWCSAPLATLNSLGRERFSWRFQLQQAARERAAYDANATGAAAPITEFLSKRALSGICKRFNDVDMMLENASPEGMFRSFSRETLIASPLARYAGLDVYLRARK